MLSLSTKGFTICTLLVFITAQIHRVYGTMQKKQKKFYRNYKNESLVNLKQIFEVRAARTLVAMKVQGSSFFISSIDIQAQNIPIVQWQF